MDYSEKPMLAALVLLVVLATGCAHQPVQASDDPSTPEPVAVMQNLPFERSGDPNGISPTAAITPHAIPAGTPIKVRLQSFVSSAASHAGDAFTAVLEEPVVIDSETVIARGATIT